MKKFLFTVLAAAVSTSVAFSAYSATLTNTETTVTKEIINTPRHTDDKTVMLLLSSSGYKDTGYLTHAKDYINDFLAENKLQDSEIVFIPFAGVRTTYDGYESKVQNALSNPKIKSIHHFSNMKDAINQAKVIMVGGGNSFELLNQMYKNDLVQAISKRVKNGDAIYIGWSAGSNLAGKTIKTTNDMPIVEPESLASLNLFPYQINPHFISGKIPGHNGESREERLEEYLIVNKEDKIYCLPEGAMIKYQNGHFTIIGLSDALLMTYPANFEKLPQNQVY